MIQNFFLFIQFFMYWKVKKNFRVFRKIFKIFFFQKTLSKFWKKKILKNFRNNLNFFFTFQYIKNWMDKKKFGSLLLSKKKNGSLIKTSFENFVIGSQCGGFQFMLILDLWGISFHPAVVVGLGNDLLFNSSVGHCVTLRTRFYFCCSKIWNTVL